MSISSASISKPRQELWARLLNRQFLWMLLYFGLTTWVIFSAFVKWTYDDPFISYRYAKNLAQGLGFVYNPGEHILSTTTPLFTILLALLTPLQVDLPILANLIGAASLSLGALFLADIGRSLGKPLVSWAGLLLYPSFPLLLTTLGSETPLCLALCLGAIAFYARRRYLPVAIFSALAVLARPDAVIVPLVLAIDILIRVHSAGPNFSLAWRSLPWKAVTVFLGLTLPWLVFAWVYFGSPIPVTLYAKYQQGTMVTSQQFSAGFLRMAAMYASQSFYWIEGGLAVLGLAAALHDLKKWGIFLAWIGLYFAGYSVLRVNSYYWYYAPLVVGLVVLIGLGVSTLRSLLPPVRSRLAFTLGLVLITSLGLVQAGNIGQIKNNRDGRTFVYRSVARWLKNRTPPNSLVGCLEVGIIGYYSERPMIDFAGLLQPAIAAQIHSEGAYSNAAQWAVQHYRPDYLVLHEDAFPQLEQGYVAENCNRVHHFPGKRYNYRTNLIIYECETQADQ